MVSQRVRHIWATELNWTEKHRLWGLVSRSCCLVAKLSDSLVAARFLCPWDFPSKNPGVGCHFLSRGSFQPGDWTWVSRIGRWIVFHWATRESPKFLFSKFGCSPRICSSYRFPGDADPPAGLGARLWIHCPALCCPSLERYTWVFYILLLTRSVIQDKILENHLKDEILHTDELNFIKFSFLMHLEITCCGD